MVIEDDESDLDSDTEGVEAGNKAGGHAERRQLGDGNESSDEEELPLFEEILKRQTIRDNAKLPALDDNQESSGAEKAKSFNNPPVNRESDREKANTGGELSTPRKRKLDQLKQPDDVDYNSDDSDKDGGEHGGSLRPLKLQKPPDSRINSPPGSPPLNLDTLLPHDGTDHDSGDDKHDNDDDHTEDERAVSTARPTSPSFKEPTSPRNIAPPNNMVGNSGHSQNLDDPVNDLAEHDDDGDDESDNKDSDDGDDKDNTDNSDDDDDKGSRKGRRYAERQRLSASVRGDSAPKHAAKHRARRHRRSSSTSSINGSDVSNAHTSNHQLMRRRTIVAQRRCNESVIGSDESISDCSEWTSSGSEELFSDVDERRTWPDSICWNIKTRIAISDSHAHYTRIAKMAQSSGHKLKELIYCVRAASGNEILANDTVFIPFLRDLSRLQLDPIVVVLKPRVQLISVSKTWERITYSSFYAAYMLYLLSSVIILLWYGGKTLSAIMRGL